MKKNTYIVEKILLMIVLFVFGISAVETAAAETYSATTMRLLKYEGNVEIEDATGASSLVMENIRFNSGDTLHTGADGYASVGLDSSKIVSLDKDTSVGFIKDSNAMEMELTDGTIFLDVQEKLDENETLDIKTSNMTVGIRGTIVFVTAARVNAAGPVKTTLGVLEGTARVTVKDENGNKRVVDIPAGEKAVTTPSEGGKGPVLDVKGLTMNDIENFAKGQIETQDGVQERVNPVINKIKDAQESEINDPASEADWECTDTVTLVAQSASKMYDGEPLTRTGDVLVYGLPAEYSITVSASGSQTEAGTGDNVVDTYTIKDKKGKDVTKHFKNIECVKGELVVEKAPLTIWTSSAVKTYDGTPLVSPDAKLTFSAGYETGQVPWRNTSYVATQKSSASAAAAGDEQILYGVCGITKVHGTNPITGETKNIDIKAGEKLTVILNDKQDEKSIEFKVEAAKISEIPEEIIRMYADNVQLLNTAAVDAGWTEEQIKELNARIQKLTEKDASLSETERTKTTEWNGLEIDQDQVDRMQLDLTDVRLTIDTDITNYNNRALGKEETHYTPVKVNNRIKLTAVGSQTDAGTSPNLYKIDWDGLKGNYEVTEKIGTLTVTQAPVTVTTGSGRKEYDGTPLTNPEASISGLVNGETASVTATGSITEAGTETNTYIIDWGGTNVFNYIVSEDLGTLEVAKNGSVITVSVSVTSKTYDGTPLTGDSVRVDGLPSGIKPASVSVQSAEEVTVSADSDDSGGDFSGYTYKVSVSGSVTDVGSAKCTIDSFQIFDPDGKDVTSQFFNITTEDCILTVTPAQLTVTTGSASKEYDGTALTSTEASITGLAAADQSQVTVTGTGTITDVGTAENAYSIVWGTASEDNYTLTEKLGTLKVAENTTAITFKAASAEKVYDGTALSDDSVTVTGLPSGLLYTADVSGSRTDAGSSDNTVDSYKILNAEEEDVTSNFSNITTEKGTLTVTKAAATVTTDSASKEYDGTALTSTGASITGLTTADQSQVTVTGTGTITDVGTAENAYSIVWGTASEDNYTLTENLGTLEVTVNTAAITFKAASAEKVYDGTALSDDSVTVTGLPSGLLYTADVSGSRTDAGSSDNTVDSYKILNAEEEDVTSNFSNITTEKGTLTVTKAAATVTTDSASKEYDGTALTSTGASITGLTTADQSQVTVTGSGSITDVGTAQNTYDISWGSASGDNYTLTESLGTLEVTKNSTAITFKADSAEKEYDDTALTKDSVTVTGLPSGLLYTADVSGSQTAVGSSDNTVASYKILNADEEDVTSNFTSITTEKGTLTVTKNSTEITFTSASAEKVYDGTPLHANEVTVEGLPSGFTYEAGASGVFGIGSDVGSYENKFDDYSYSGVDEDGNPIFGWRYYIIKNADGEDVSDNFTNVSMVTGTITITPAAATVITPSDSKTYDGTALTCTDGAAITGLVDGETATVTADGTITDVGTTDNTYSITWGTAKETNYTLTENLGTLEVKALDVTFKVNTYTTTYDSFVHLPEGVSCTCNGTQLDPSTEYYADDSTLYMMVFDLPGGQIRLNGTCFTDADTYDATPYYAFESGTESNYNITFTNTEMIIEKATAIVTTGSATGPSGTAYPVTSEEAYISFLAHNDSGKVTVTATGKCTSVGSTVNTYEIDWGEVKSSNYTIVENLGTLTMFNAVIPVSEESTGSAVSTPASGNAAPKKEQENQTSETNETADSSTSDQEKAAAGDSESENSEDKAASDAENAETAETEPEETKEKSETEAVKESEEKSEEKAVEESEKESEEKQAAETEKKSEEKAAEETKEKSEEKTAVETEKKTEDKAAEVSEKKTEEKAAEVSEKKSEEKNEVKSEAKKEEKTSEKSVEKAEATVPEKTEEKSEEETGKKPEDEAAKEEETEE